MYITSPLDNKNTVASGKSHPSDISDPPSSPAHEEPSPAQTPQSSSTDVPPHTPAQSSTLPEQSHSPSAIPEPPQTPHSSSTDAPPPKT